jgi:hypothetical protein
MKKIVSAVLVSSVISLGFVGSSLAEETVTEKAGEVASDTGKVVKKGYRAAKDKTCHLVNGKMECAAQKVKHGAQNASDEVMDKTDDVKKKIN